MGAVRCRRQAKYSRTAQEADSATTQANLACPVARYEVAPTAKSVIRSVGERSSSRVQMPAASYEESLELDLASFLTDGYGRLVDRQHEDSRVSFVRAASGACGWRSEAHAHRS